MTVAVVIRLCQVLTFPLRVGYHRVTRLQRLDTMPIISLPGTPSSYATGQQAGSFVAKVADEAANFACSLYKNLPGAVVGNPINSFNRGLYDSLCSGRPSGLPAPPQKQFEGGQCDCVAYLFDVIITQPGTDEPIVVSGGVPGKIGGLVETPVSGVQGVIGVYVSYVECNPDGTKSTKLLSISNRLAGGSSTLSNVRRQDGLPDNCGDPPPAYPPESYIVPDGGFTGTGSVTYNDGTDLAIPLVYAPISVPVSLNPRFNVDVGGITLQFSTGGVSIDLGNENSDSREPRDRFNDPSDDADRIGDAIRRLPGGDGDGDGGDPGSGGESSPPPPQAKPPDDDDSLDKETKEEDDPKEEAGVERLRWVKIILTKFPDKVQLGDGAPNCYFAGWIEFKSKEACYPREQINFATSLFLAPPGADGYAYTLTNGARGYAIVYKAKEAA